MFGFYRPELLPSESSRRHLSVSPVDSVHKHDQTHDCARASRGLSALLSSYLCKKYELATGDLPLWESTVGNWPLTCFAAPPLLE